jgi:hypothetical protein
MAIYEEGIFFRNTFKVGGPTFKIKFNSDFAGQQKIVFLQPFLENRSGDSPLAQLVRASDC